MIRSFRTLNRAGVAAVVVLSTTVAAAETPDSTKLYGAWWWTETRGVDAGRGGASETPATTGRSRLLLLEENRSYRFVQWDSVGQSFRCEGAVVVHDAAGIRSGAGMKPDFWITFMDWCEPWIRDQLVRLAGPDTLMAYPGSPVLTVPDSPTLVFTRLRSSLADSMIAGIGPRFPYDHGVPPELRDSWPRGQEGEFVYYEEEPIPLKRVDPVYPEWLKTAEIECDVVVHVLVGKNGLVRNTRVIKGVTGVNDAVVDAVKQWIFKPAVASGRPVAVWAELKFHYPP